jgi:hypothetical protein
MFASAHLAAGGAARRLARTKSSSVGKGIVLAATLGMLSHFALDAIPHADYAPIRLHARILPIVIGESLAMSFLVAWCLRGTQWRATLPLIIAGVLSAGALDAKFPAMFLLPRNVSGRVTRIGDHIHEFFHAAEPSVTVGWTTQIVATTLLIIVVLRLRKRVASLRP